MISSGSQALLKFLHWLSVPMVYKKVPVN
jgi:hypothetical protein